MAVEWKRLVFADDISGKADKVASTPDPSGYVATFNSTGNLVVSDKLVSNIGVGDSGITQQEAIMIALIYG